MGIVYAYELLDLGPHSSLHLHDDGCGGDDDDDFEFDGDGGPHKYDHHEPKS